MKKSIVNTLALTVFLWLVQQLHGQVNFTGPKLPGQPKNQSVTGNIVMDGVPGNTTVTMDGNNIVTANLTPDMDQALLDAFEESLRNDLLYPYYPTAGVDPSVDRTALDDSYGGFVENRSSTWAWQQDSDKWIVAQARYTWMAAKASQFYADNPSQAELYLQSAAAGFSFLKKMWGYDYGGGKIGVALVVDRDGSNGRIGNKGNYIIYGNAFAIYAAAAYYAASSEQAALDFAIDVYNFINDYAYDDQFGGYYDNASSTNKTIETNLHMFEALIELYQDMPPSHSLRSEVASYLAELLAHLHDDVIHCDTNFETDCFAYLVMNRDWSPYSNSISFGHDAEMAMLMEKALVVLELDPSTYLTKIKNMVDFLFTHSGYRSDGALYYTGTYNNGNVSVTDNQLQWWPQGEGLGAVCLMRKLFPNDPFYSDIINLSWSFIESDVIDHTNNGWVNQAGQMNIAKASEWHANYHSGRALMNALDWLSDKLTMAVDPTGSGTTDPAVGGHWKAEGTVVDITAVSNAGYRFDHWTGDVADVNSASTTVTMDGGKSVTANFTALPTHVLTTAVEPTGAGTISPSAGIHTYYEGDIVPITATPAVGYAFDHWNAACTGSGVCSVTMDADKSVIAVFVVSSATSAATPSNATPAVGQQIVVSINVDMTYVVAADNKLGSFTGSLVWDPAVLAYASHSGLLAGFTGAVNAANVSSGQIAFNGANATGTTGDFVIFQITFDVVGTGTSVLDLEYTAMAAAFTFADLLPILTVTDGQVVASFGILGDINEDDAANSTDALIILSCDVGMDVSAFCPMNCGDVNADGLVNSTDALIILSYDVGMSVPFSIGEAGCPSNVTQCPGCNP